VPPPSGGSIPTRPDSGAALRAAFALAAAPAGFTVADLAAKVRALTANPGYTSRQAAYDLRKLRAHDLLIKIARTRRYLVPPEAARTIAGITILRDEILLPVLAGLRNPRRQRRPRIYTATDRQGSELCVGDLG
jgi:hypothetical protein